MYRLLPHYSTVRTTTKLKVKSINYSPCIIKFRSRRWITVPKINDISFSYIPNSLAWLSILKSDGTQDGIRNWLWDESSVGQKIDSSPKRAVIAKRIVNHPWRLTSVARCSCVHTWNLKSFLWNFITFSVCHIIKYIFLSSFQLFCRPSSW